ncbi:fungal-specific transcription factor domain-domain-containing protein [Naematelia encephala]|uniref:Fungal-specific transcription factor domain-domain-containing protein n=1 Tax=Naematelia encephala TaxID=71784 RepID=A0A1Y2BJV2_9TREE|nr:fungal-specific transcription factor domain-domain-containing protein [Naematelia encephala]
MSRQEEDLGTMTAAKRRKTNVSRACTTCRRRRVRCDGLPRCSTCQVSDVECIYDPDQDGRKPATKLYVEALVNRVKALEEQLANQDGNTSSTPGSPMDTGLTTAARLLESEGARGTLRIENNSVMHHGPSSAFMHLPDISDRLQEDVEIVGWSPEAFSPGQDLASVPWHRHLPVGCVADSDEHERHLDLFFSYLNGWCYNIDEASFRAGLYASASSSSPSWRNSHYSPLLHNAMLALTCPLAADRPGHYDHSRAELLANQASSYLDAEACQPMISTVRGLMLLGSYHWSTWRHSLGWLYEGMGVRMAQTLGLNVDCSNLVTRGVITEAVKKQRDRAFFTVYTQDQLWSLAIGRTAGLTMEDFETAIPEINADDDAMPWLDHHQRAALRLGTMPVINPSWTSSTFHHTCTLALLSDRMHQALYRMRSRYDEKTRQSLIAELHLALNRWLVELPSPLRFENHHPWPPHVINMHLLCRYLQILIHRPTYTRPLAVCNADRELARKTCDMAAAEILQLLLLYRKSPGLQYVTTTIVNVAFTAGTIFLLAAVQTDANKKRHSDSISSAKECIQCLREMGWGAAGHGGDLLQSMMDEWSPPTPPPPPTVQLPTEMSVDVNKLHDPNSEIGQLLTRLGWRPPVGQEASSSTPQTVNPVPMPNEMSFDPSSLLQSWLRTASADPAWDFSM